MKPTPTIPLTNHCWLNVLPRETPACVLYASWKRENVRLEETFKLAVVRGVSEYDQPRPALPEEVLGTEASGEIRSVALLPVRNRCDRKPESDTPNEERDEYVYDSDIPAEVLKRRSPYKKALSAEFMTGALLTA